MTKQEHEKAVKRFNALMAQKDALTKKAVRSIDVRTLIAGSMEQRKNKRRAFIVNMLKLTTPHFKQAQRIGDELARTK